MRNEEKREIIGKRNEKLRYEFRVEFFQFGRQNSDSCFDLERRDEKRGK